MIIEKPNWLPEKFIMDGNWERKIVELYQIFVRDFEHGKPIFDNYEVWWDQRVLDGEFPEGFWHITTKGKSPNRLPDFRRAERLPWCCPCITNSSDPIILKWDYLESKSIRTYIWLENFDYVVVLEKKKFRKQNVAFLVTAYYLDGDSGKRNLKKKYHNRV